MSWGRLGTLAALFFVLPTAFPKGRLSMAAIVVWSVMSFVAGYVVAWNIHRQRFTRNAKGQYSKSDDSAS
jgi:hypothetical protein